MTILNLGTHIHASYSTKQEILNLLLSTLHAATLKKENAVPLPCGLEDVSFLHLG